MHRIGGLCIKDSLTEESIIIIWSGTYFLLPLQTNLSGERENTKTRILRGGIFGDCRHGGAS